MKKISTIALSLIVCFTLVNMIGCRKFDKKKEKKTTHTVENVKTEKAKIKNMKVKEPAELR